MKQKSTEINVNIVRVFHGMSSDHVDNQSKLINYTVHLLFYITYSMKGQLSANVIKTVLHIYCICPLQLLTF